MSITYEHHKIVDFMVQYQTSVDACHFKKQWWEKKSLKRQKTVRSKRMTDVSYPALPSPRETRANNRGMRKSEWSVK